MDEQDKKINVGSFFERNDLIDEVASAAIPTSNPAMTAVGANKLLIESLQTSIETMQTQIRDIANYIIIEHKLQKDERVKFVEQLNSKQYKKVEDFFATMPKLSHTIEVINPNTKEKNSIVLEGLADFFG